MLSTQFMQILNLCKEHNVSLSHNEIAILCNLSTECIEDVFKIFNDCDIYNKKYFLEIMMSEEYINISQYYLKILDIISDLNSVYIAELISILNKPNITTIPKFFDYINIYYTLTTRPEFVCNPEFRKAISEFLPESEEIMNNPTTQSLNISLKVLLINRIEEDYDFYVENKDVIYFSDRDDVAEGFTKDLDNFFELRSKNQKYDAAKLIRAIKPKNIPKKNNIIKVDFTGGN